ncbi:MAG: Gfo/Idh/MocA family protein [Planctomycetaceae bacterium]
MTAATSTVVRFGILGTARIASKVGRAISRAVGATVSAVASRDVNRARTWVAQHTCASPTAPDDDSGFLDTSAAVRTHGDYQALLDDPEVDAVYIPLPTSLHAPWTIRAAERGKHVLCEKPLAMNASQAHEMAAACRAHRVQFLDGVMWYHHTRTAVIQRVIRSGELGDLRRVTLGFSFNATDFRPDNIRYQRELGGGVLGDLGWYCVGASLWTFDDLPVRVFATGKYRDDVDVNFSALMWFSGDRVASFDCAFDTTTRRWLEVAGAERSIVCDDFVIPWNPASARFWVHGQDGQVRQEACDACLQEVRMVERFCDAVRGGPQLDEFVTRALATQHVCDHLDRAARSGQIVDVAPPPW